MELAVLTLFAVLFDRCAGGRCPYFVCPDSRSDPVFGIQLEMWITLEQTGKMCLKGVNTVKMC